MLTPEGPPAAQGAGGLGRGEAHAAAAPLAIVMPVLDEASALPAMLAALQPLRAPEVRLIVVDGGSTDASVAIARPLADQVVAAPRGRARQLNAGAAVAAAEGAGPGQLLVFLHADTSLPDGALPAVREAIAQGAAWGRFDVVIEGRPAMLRVVAALMNHRSRLTGIATGDQAIFMTRAAFDAVGGFPDQPLMEDIEISRRLKREVGRPACLRLKLSTSGRRWEERGVWRTIVLMWRLRLAYWLGVAPEELARRYR